MSFFGFHPIIEQWFRSRFDAPTEPQELGWPSIAAGEHTLIAAPTGSGKTLTAFLSVIDRLLKASLAGELEDKTQIVYVSPLRALSNDMHRNLEVPLEEINRLVEAEGLRIAPIRAGLRTGDTSSSQRAALVRRPPHIYVTTPESLYLLLTAEKSRENLRNVETVIVDEIHALVRDKRGSHLSLTLERLDALCGRSLQRIGLSATQKPIERMADFLVGAGNSERGTWSVELGAPHSALRAPHCSIINVGHNRPLDLAIEVPPSELGAVCMHEQWDEVNRRIIELINAHRSTLIFVNTRRLAERLTHQLTELLGEEGVGSHHGSLSADIRLTTERKLKSGELKAVVATASLELGIDIGYIDLVIQIGSPRAIATFLQRIGRSGHSLGLVPKGRLFALTRDELLECMALMRGVKQGRLDVVPIPQSPLDVLAQQIVAEVAAREWSSDELFDLCRRAYPYRNLSRDEFDRTIEYLSEGLTRTTGRSRVYLHHDRVGRRLRPRRGARLAAITNAGAIPEIASYRVVAEPEQTVVGTLDEDFAVESMAGDVFLLGNTSWRIQHVRGGDVTVTDAGGAPPTIPFWRGEAPGRTLELSQEVSQLREELERRIGENDGDSAVVAKTQAAILVDAKPQAGIETNPQSAIPNPQSPIRNPQSDSDIAAWLVAETACSEFAAQQIVQYAAAQKAAIGLLPTQRRVVFERFFDESGGMQLVVHAPFGSRINQAWGFAMRKRFCRSFDFELQASADDDGFILSLGPQHSFPLESMFTMLNERNARPLLEQAVLTVPMFQMRWRWNVTRALLVMRRRNGKKVPPALQRFRADDLLTAVFPKLTGCQENVVGDIELPDHPLARQTMEDCLHEALDVDGLKQVLAAIDRGEIELVGRDTREPSPFCYELLNANPYAFLDGGEIQERRARAVSVRRSLTVESVADLGRLDPQAIEQVHREAQPLVRNADELHDALLTRIALPAAEAAEWRDWYVELQAERRATTIALPDGRTFLVAAERLPAAMAVYPNAVADPSLVVPEGVRLDWPSSEARVDLVRGLLETCGPIAADSVAQRMAITASQAFAALEALEGEGVVLRGRFTPDCREDASGDWRDGAGDADEEGQGPRAESQEQEPLALSPSLSALSPDQSAIRNPQSEIEAIEWCHRRLLARIHRLTMEGLRRQIEPVGVDVFIRFLARHHGLTPADRRGGSNGLYEVVSMLQGFDAPAIAWERDLLPARVDKYRGEWLDELCLTGEVGWGRMVPARFNPDRSRPMVSLTRVAPLSLFLRSDREWLIANAAPCEADGLSSPAAQVAELLQTRGAMFAADLLAETRMLPAQLDEALGELVTRGLVTSDGFAGLRQLLGNRGEADSRRQTRARRKSSDPAGRFRRRNLGSSTGRWSLWRQYEPRVESPESRDDHSLLATPHSPLDWAWQLLRRWGVVFRDLLDRETSPPAWFELLQVYRRLEARGEIRGGRFIGGVAGEQFALGETVRKLRQLRDEPAAVAACENVAPEELLFVSAADPLNLAGIITADPRVPSTASNRIAYLNGLPLAALQAGEVRWFQDVPAHLQPVVAERFRLSENGLPPVSADPPSDELQSGQPPEQPENSTEDLGSQAPAEPKARQHSGRPGRIPRPMIS